MTGIKKRGGARPGSGRPRLPASERRLTKTVRLTFEQIDFIKNYSLDRQLQFLLDQKIDSLQYCLNLPMLTPDLRSDIREEIDICKEMLTILK